MPQEGNMSKKSKKLSQEECEKLAVREKEALENLDNRMDAFRVTFSAIE